MTESSQEAFERGEIAGRIETRLAGHDTHFAQINGSMADCAKELKEIRVALQAVSAGLEHERELRTGSDAALREADKDYAWSALQRVCVAVVTVVVVAAILIAARGGR